MTRLYQSHAQKNLFKVPQVFRKFFRFGFLSPWPVPKLANLTTIVDVYTIFTLFSNSYFRRSKVHCCIRLSIGMSWDWWSRQRANDKYKYHLDGQLTRKSMSQTKEISHSRWLDQAIVDFLSVSGHFSNVIEDIVVNSFYFLNTPSSWSDSNLFKLL